MRVQWTELTNKAALLTGVAVMVLGVATATPAYARDGADDTNTSTSGKRMQMSTTESPEQTHTESEQEAETEHSQTTKLEAKRGEVKERLSDKRAELCKKRETAINKVVQNSHMRSEKVLKHLQQVEQRVKDFYVKKDLKVANYSELVAAMDTAEAAASASVDELGQITFTCSDDNANNPGSTVKEAVTAKHTAMDGYRDAIRAFVKAILSTTGEETTR